MRTGRVAIKTGGFLIQTGISGRWTCFSVDLFKLNRLNYELDLRSRKLHVLILSTRENQNDRDFFVDLIAVNENDIGYDELRAIKSNAALAQATRTIYIDVFTVARELFITAKTAIKSSVRVVKIKP